MVHPVLEVVLLVKFQDSVTLAADLGGTLMGEASRLHDGRVGIPLQVKAVASQRIAVEQDVSLAGPVTSLAGNAELGHPGIEAQLGQGRLGPSPIR